MCRLPSTLGSHLPQGLCSAAAPAWTPLCSPWRELSSPRCPAGQVLPITWIVPVCPSVGSCCGTLFSLCSPVPYPAPGPSAPSPAPNEANAHTRISRAGTAEARVQTTRPIYRPFSPQRSSYIFPNSSFIFLSKIHGFHICLARGN